MQNSLVWFLNEQVNPSQKKNILERMDKPEAQKRAE